MCFLWYLAGWLLVEVIFRSLSPRESRLMASGEDGCLLHPAPNHGKTVKQSNLVARSLRPEIIALKQIILCSCGFSRHRNPIPCREDEIDVAEQSMERAFRSLVNDWRYTEGRNMILPTAKREKGEEKSNARLYIVFTLFYCKLRYLFCRRAFFSSTKSAI